MSGTLYDMIIVGGGPAGLATAIYARLHGLNCIVFDKRSLPLDKACGEGLLPRGVDHLEKMGVSVSSLRSSPFFGIRWVAGDVIAEGRFSGRAGCGIRRTVLIRSLVDRALQLGADLHYGRTVASWEADRTGAQVVVDGQAFKGRFLVGADGLHSTVRGRLDLERPVNGERRFGIRKHFHIRPWAPFVEVHLADDAEAAVAPVAEDEIVVTTIGPPDGRTFEQSVALFPILAARLQGVEAIDTSRGAGPFPIRVKRRYSGRVALVGDAAGYLDPVTGEGLSLGFASASALAQTIAAGLPLSAYEREYRRLSVGYDRVTRTVLAITRRPWLRHRTVKLLADNPELLSGLLAVNDSESWTRALGASGIARLITGILWPAPLAGQASLSPPGS